MINRTKKYSKNIRTKKRRNMLKLPTSIKTFFLTLHVCFGIDFGFGILLNKTLRKKLFIVNYILISVTVIAGLTIPDRYLTKNPIFWVCLVQYTGNFILLRIVKYKIYDFIVDATAILYKMSKSKSKMLRIIVTVPPAVLITRMIILSFVRCSFRFKHCDSFVKTFLYVNYYYYNDLVMDLNGLSEIIIIYYIKCCIQDWKEFLKRPGQDMKIALMRYAAIADCYDKIRPLYDTMITFKLLTNVPSTTTALVFLLINLNIRLDLFWFTNIMNLSSSLFLRICIPAFVVETINTQMDSIKLLLNDHLLNELDEKRARDLEDLVRYINGRPLRHLVFRFIPVDLRLVLFLLTFCTSYLITTVQFLHLYD